MNDVPNAPAEESRKIDDIAEELHGDYLSSRPLYAAQMGYRGYLGELPDLSLDGRERRRGRLTAWRARAAAVDPSALESERRITRDIAIRWAADEMLALDAAAEEYTVTPIPQTGLAASIIISLPKVLLRDGDDAEAYLRACRSVPAWLKDAAALLASGEASGRTPVRRLVANAAAQLDDYLSAPLGDDPLLGVAAPPGVAGDWRDKLAGVVRDEVRPALAAYRDHLRHHVIEVSRPDDEAGLGRLPGGLERYQQLAARHTTTDLPVEDIHQAGLDLVARLTEEFSRLGGQVFGTADVTEIAARLRGDPDLFFGTPEEVAAAAASAMARAEAELPRWLSVLPKTGCRVVPMPAIETENGDLGHYQWPSRDGSRPGTYWINTSKPRTRPRFESEALAFHESVPGHHTQLTVAQELEGQCEFRRHVSITAFQEGWALYVERLADEMGLYSGDIYRLGMLSFDFWRACRLVVDTGMHAMGWGRDAAVRYMLDNSALTRKNIENEVDRYIGWPGQALGYMVGRLEIRRLRDRSAQALGHRFSLREFHDEVIRHGSLPLPVLDEVVGRWTAELAA